jgi:ribosomal protein S18 acetylase RimI-like enzyme
LADAKPPRDAKPPPDAKPRPNAKPLPEPKPLIRPAEAADAAAVTRLLYETSTGMYDIYAGGAQRALRILGAAYARPGNSASQETVWVAELDSEVAGMVAAFPVAEGDRRASRFLRITLARTPPWMWPRTLRIFHAGADSTPVPPADSLYVDALATVDRFRRRGVASALLEECDRLASRAGLPTVALDTAATNEAAQALYERAGFVVTERRPPNDRIPGIVGYARATG